MKILPVRDQILIRPIKTEKTKAGIYLPQAACDSDTVHHGEVVDVGPGRVCEDGVRRGVCVNPGDRVLYSGFMSNYTVECDGETLILGNNDDILAIVNETEEE